MQYRPAFSDQNLCHRSWLPLILDRDHYINIVHIPCSRQPTHILTARLSVNFGNLPFASAIQANHHPPDVQLAQQQNLVVPAWAMRTINGAAPSADPFECILSTLEPNTAQEVQAKDFCGQHAYVGALDSEQVYHRAPKLSQIVARIIHSIKLGEYASKITEYAMMHHYWALLRWMLFPSAESYLAMPPLIRPTPYQLFVPHARTFDFLIVPALRDFMCQREVPDARWLTEGARTIQYNEIPSREAQSTSVTELLIRTLCFSSETGQLDLSPTCKV